MAVSSPEMAGRILGSYSMGNLEDRRWWVLQQLLQTALRTSLRTTSVPFLRDRAFCSQSYKGAKHPSGEGKALEPGIWQNASED